MTIADKCLALVGQCESPVECAAWGYCRERNRAASIDALAALGVDPIHAIERRRLEAASRRQVLRLAQAPASWVEWTVNNTVGMFPRLTQAKEVDILARCVAVSAEAMGLEVDRAAVRQAVVDRLRRGKA